MIIKMNDTYDRNPTTLNESTEYFPFMCFCCYRQRYFKEGVYKAFKPTKSGKLKCLNKEYEVGKKSYVRGELELCANGIHYCTNLFDIFNHYSGQYGKDFVVAECEVSDENIAGERDSKHCARWVIPKRILTRKELIKQLKEGEER